MTASPMALRRSTEEEPAPFGATVTCNGSISFGFWAPTQSRVEVELVASGVRLAMQRDGDGRFGLVTNQAKPGDLYRYVLEDGTVVPDPASRFQPEDVSGPSQIVDPSKFQWDDADYRGRPWEECVLYELHVGSFTPGGTFLSAIEKLGHLVELGVTAIEIMPVADFPGERNWGYDGVMLYAPDSAYGTPDELRTLVKAAHECGLMVFLDVVYNHFGPEGNLMGNYAPDLFTERHKTPWGNAINYAHPAVREFIIGNACYWMRDFHLDGLRLDAVHAIIDESPKHVLEELAERVRAEAGSRHVHLVLENDLNQARFLEREPDGRPRWYNAQWNDDFHHCLHAAATRETFGYYCSYTQCLPLTARSLAEGFAYQGEVAPFTRQPRGEISAHLPPTSFVNFVQNHDQIGNRPFGERITEITSDDAARAIIAVYLLAPEIPLLFMGEEWRAEQPFQYFCGFDGKLAESIRNGRREEFSGFPEFSDPGQRDRIPDPTAPETFAASKLDWADIDDPDHRNWLEWYRAILAVRRQRLTPFLAGAPGGVAEYNLGENGCIEVCWRLGQERHLHLIANLQGKPAKHTGKSSGDRLWMEGEMDEEGELSPWTVIWLLSENGRTG